MAFMFPLSGCSQTRIRDAINDVNVRVVALEEGGGGGGAAPGDTVAAETSYGLAASAGDATTYSRSNHTHGSPALGDAAPPALGTATAGSSSLPARQDHVHPPTGLALSSHNHDATYAALSHAHPISEVTNLQTTLDGKSATSHNHDAAYAALGHTHSQLHDRQHSITSVSDHTFPGGTTTFLRADGTFAAPPGGGGEAFPVGSVFISVVSTDPATLLGYGTWSAFGAGRVLVGIDAGQTEFDTVEETGGAKTVTLTEAEIPSHTHTVNRFPTATGGSTGFTVDTSMSGTQTASNQSTTATGGGGAHSNLPPYIVVYMFKRTA